MDGFIFVVLLFLVFVGLMVLLISNIKGKLSSYLSAVIATLCAWFIGLILDANIRFEPVGFLYLRVLFPILAMGVCILKAIMKAKSD